jgi:hypothetical protein
LRRGINRILTGDDAFSCISLQLHLGTFRYLLEHAVACRLPSKASTPEPPKSVIVHTIRRILALFNVNMGLNVREAALAAVLLFSAAATAHEHHVNKIEQGQAVSADPIDSILWIHILVQGFAWGIIFPVGMVLGVGLLS